MRLLLHTCCGPCLLYPLEYLRSSGIEVISYFNNPNIHPYTEYKKRLNCLKSVTLSEKIPLIVEPDYDLDHFLAEVSHNVDSRCSICYRIRLTSAALFAKENGFDAFSSTLLYSTYQNHNMLQSTANYLSRLYKIDFFYHDFREGWQHGIDLAIEKDLYRQKYCGCIYSERDRYDNRFKKKIRKLQNKIKIQQ